MNNLLQEFENLQPERSKIALTIIYLYIAICLVVIPFILLLVYKSFAENDSSLDRGVYILLVGLILFPTTLYLVIRNKIVGWLLLVVISAFLWGFFAKIVFFYSTSTWEVASLLNAFLSAFVFTASSLLLALLYLPPTLKTYKINLTVITIAVIINVLTISAILMSFE